MAKFDLLGFIGNQLPLRLPKEVLIYNGPLTVLQLSLQITLTFALLYSFWSSRQYLVVSTAQMSPNAWTNSIKCNQNAWTNSIKCNQNAWTNSVSGPVAQASIAADMNNRACQSATQSEFSFQYGSTFIQADYPVMYDGWDCIELPMNERAQKVGNTIMYYPSFFEELNSQFAYGINDCANLESTCGVVHTVTSTLVGNNTVTTSVPSSPDYKCKQAEYIWGSPCYSSYGAANDPLRWCSCERKKQFLVAGLVHQKMELSHSYEDQHPTSNQIGANGKSSNSLTQVAEIGSDTVRPVLTIIMQFDTVSSSFKEFDCGKPSAGKCRFQPTSNTAPDISMTLGEWATAAGIDLTHADTINTQAGGNNGLNDKHNKPLLRITGAEITLKISYYDQEFLEDDYGVDSNFVIARIQVKARADWSSMPTTSYGTLPFAGQTSGSATSRYRYTYGLRFVFKEGSSGKFGYFVGAALASVAAIFLVYINSVNKFMKLFVTYALADTGRNYRRAQEDTFNIDRDAQQTGPARVLMAAAAFNALCQENADYVKYVGGKPMLTQAAVVACFKKVVGGLLPDDQVEKMGKITFYSISQHETFGSDRKVGSGMAAVGLGVSSSPDKARASYGNGDDDGIDAQTFVKSCLRNDVLDLPALANMFDPTDEKSVLEKIFGERGVLRQRLEGRVDSEYATPDGRFQTPVKVAPS